MEVDSYEAIVQYAIQKEREAAEFYETLSRMAVMEGVRDMLTEFAAEERKHERILKDVDCTNECKIATSQYHFRWISDIKRSDLLLDIPFDPNMGYRDVLIVAMKREEKALALYNELLEKSQSEQAKNVFKLLCQEEAKHKLKLETLYDDFMKEMGD
ncbi:MAG: ferritin family protein [Thermodesulfobacteriota bacterium]